MRFHKFAAVMVLGFSVAAYGRGWDVHVIKFPSQKKQKSPQPSLTPSPEERAYSPEILEAPSSLCLVSYNTKSQRINCSGTLISRNCLVTAAHCFPFSPAKLATSIRIQCGLKSQATRGGDFSFTEDFTAKEVRLASDGRGASGVDFAFIRLNKTAQNVSPMEVPTSLSTFRGEFMTQSQIGPDFEFKSSIDCRSSGFGYDTKKKNSYFLTSDQSPRNGLRGYQSSTDNASDLVIRSWGKDIATFRHGDSGGAFYCRRDADSDWQLLGVISAGLFYRGEGTGESFLAATPSHEFLNSFRKIRDEWK